MRKVFVVGLLTFLVVTVGVWCGMWFAQARQSKASIEQFISRINADNHYITYDNMETSGFPNDVVITITNPRFQGRVDEIINRLVPQTLSNNPHTLPQWTEDILLKGALTMSVNALSDRYVFGINGNWVQNSQMDGVPLAHITTREPYSQSCELTLEKGTFANNMWSFTLFSSGEEFLQHFRGLDCASSGYAIVDSATDAILISSGPSSIMVSYQPGDSTELRARVKAVDTEFTIEGDKLISSYVKAFSGDSFYPMYYAYYGKQNVEFDFSYKGPSFSNPPDAMSALEINLGKLDIRNSLYSMKGHFLLKSEPAADQNIKAVLNTRFDTLCTKQYDDLVKNIVFDFIKYAQASNDPSLAGIRDALGGHTPEQAYAMALPALPSFSELGNWVQAANVTYEGKKDFSNGSANLSELAITFTPYGITANGSAKKTEASPFPEALFNVACNGCTQLVDDFTGYINRLSDVMHSFEPENPAYEFKLSTDLVQGIKTFLSQLSASKPEENSNGNYTFVMQSDASGNMTVSGRSAMEVMALYNEHIASKLMPAAGEGMPQKSDVPAQGWKVE